MTATNQELIRQPPPLPGCTTGDTRRKWSAAPLARKEEVKREASKQLFPSHQVIRRRQDVEYRKKVINALVAEVPKVLKWLEKPENWKTFPIHVMARSGSITAGRMAKRVLNNDFSGLYLDIYTDTRKHISGISVNTDYSRLPVVYQNIWSRGAFNDIFAESFDKYPW